MNVPVLIVLVAAVTGVLTLAARLRAATDERRSPHPPRETLLVRSSWIALILTAAMASGGAAVGVAVIRAGSAVPGDAASIGPRTAVTIAMSPRGPGRQSGRPHFDVASVRPCRSSPPAPSAEGRSASQGEASPGRFRIDCLSAAVLINTAYVTFADGRYNPPSARASYDMLSGPQWVRSEQFTIEATASDTTPVAMMRGPMLQTLLENRFKLRIRREAREVAVLQLEIASGGAKVTPFKPGACLPWDWRVFPQPPVAPGQRRCTAGTERNSDGNFVQTVEAMTLDDWAASLGTRYGEPIVNGTGITGLQTFDLVYSGRSDEFPVEVRDQLGLALRPSTAMREFLILDHIERPTQDTPPAVPARARGPGR